MNLFLIVFLDKLKKLILPCYAFCMKHLDSGVNVIQLETAAGAAMKDFNGAIGNILLEFN